MAMIEILEKAYEYGAKYYDYGKVADYIPELAKEDKTKSAISFMDKDGTLYNVGDTAYRFSIQSVVKVVIYLCVLENYEFEEIKKYVGLKPSSKPFNSIIELELSNKNIPVNPFINAGAIVSTYLVYKKFGDKAFEVILNKLKELTGNNDLYYSEKIFQSEKSMAYANRALTYLMLSSDILPDYMDVEAVLDIYFKSCSIMINTEELARESSILSNDGLDILTGEQKMSSHDARILRTLMATCGTYDYSGEFAIRIGIPAKSGVGGGILTASKMGYGIAVYCPGLDSHGNSYSGTRMLEHLSNALELKIY